MKSLVYAIAALGCLMAAPLLIAPAGAQVSVGVGDEGARVRIGPGDERGRARAEDRGRHFGRNDRDACREVTVRTRHPDGSVSATTKRRCN